VAKSGPTYEEIIASVKEGALAPVYLFHGDEDFLAEECTRIIIGRGLPEDQRGFNLDVLYGGDVDARTVLSRVTSFPMMGERRVVVVKDFDSVRDSDNLTQYVEEPLSTTCLVLVAQKVDMRKRPFVTVKKRGVVIECKRLYEDRIPAWIGKRVQQDGRTIEPKASALLATYTGNSLRDVRNELDKLYTFIGDRSAITADDVMAVAGVSKEYNIFELQRALGQRDLKRSTEIMAMILDSGGSALMITAMLTRFFVTLWKLHDLRARGTQQQEIARELGIHPFFFDEYKTATDLFSLADIGKAFELLVRAEEEIKTSQSGDDHVMHLFVVELLHTPEMAHS
jgi:DNA polymerase-3 subunit delta